MTHVSRFDGISKFKIPLRYKDLQMRIRSLLHFWRGGLFNASSQAEFIKTTGNGVSQLRIYLTPVNPLQRGGRAILHKNSYQSAHPPLDEHFPGFFYDIPQSTLHVAESSSGR